MTTSTTSWRYSGLSVSERPLRILLIGGTTFIGRLLADELLKAGHQLSLLHRKPKHPFGKCVTNFVADRNDVETVRAALGSTRFDVVYDFVYDWQRGTTGAQVEACARLFEGQVSRYIFMSSVAAYGDGLNHHEGDPLAPDDHPELYVRNKAVSERALFRLNQKSNFPVVTLRPPFVYGPGNPYYREAFFWDRIRAGRPIVLPGDGHRLMQFVHVRDLVEMALRVMNPPNLAGHAFNMANPRPITQREVVSALYGASDVAFGNVVSIPRELIRRLGGQAIGARLYFGDYYDLPPITMVVTKAQRMLGFKPMDFCVGLRGEYLAYLKKRAYPRPDFAFEDYLLGRFRAQNQSPLSA